MEKGRGRITQRSDGVWFTRLPKNVCEDTHFPFENGEQVKVSFTKKELKIEKFPKKVKCRSCDSEAELVKVNSDATAEYRCPKCGDVFDE